MRIVVVGATGNLGTSVLRALDGEGGHEVVAVARRLPEPAFRTALPVTEWRAADIACDDLAPMLAGADVVIALAWLIQPSRDQATLQCVNVSGNERLFRAVVRVGVPRLIYASSVGAYSPGASARPVDESWPTNGVQTSYYSRQKAEVERALDRLEREHSSLRVVRMRPALVFKREAATGIRRLFAGPFLPGSALHLLPLVPAISGLRFQCVHADDVGKAFAAAATRDVRGAFNLAAEPVLASTVLAELLGARPITLPASVARGAAALAWHARLTSISPDWLDLGLKAPTMNTARATELLGWTPQHNAREALAELLDGIRRNADAPTPPLSRTSSGLARWRELATGVGARDKG